MIAHFYEDLSRLSVSLDAEGRGEEATQLREAVAAGATGTEILMSVRWLLGRIARDSRPMSESTRRNVAELARQATALLGAP